MPIPKIIGAQRDFSGGELDEAVKRADEMPLIKTGARQLSNFRILQGGQAQNRPGRRALFIEPGRVEEVLMSPGNLFYIAFGDGYMRIYDANGTPVAGAYVKGDGSTPLPWKAATAGSIVITVVPRPKPQIYIAYGHDFPLNVPLIWTWDGASSWTLSNYAEAILGTGQKRTIFDRLSIPSVTMLPSDVIGNITLITSDSIFTPGMIGTYLLWCGREILITGYTSPTLAAGFCTERLPNTVHVLLGQFINVGADGDAFIASINGTFGIGDLVTGSLSGAKGIVVGTGTELSIAGTAQNAVFAQVTYVNVQILPTSSNAAPLPYFLPGTVGFTSYFQWKEFLVGPNGNGQVGATALRGPSAVSVWDNEVMNNYRGWPTSVFYDQERLGFCGFSDAQDAIAWSSIGLPEDIYVNGLATSINADNAIFERVPDGASVYFVVPGMESNEFVFCNTAIYYIPISVQNPLTPGTVAFNRLTSQGSEPNVKPVVIQQSILYVRHGSASMGAVQTPGYYFRPHVIDNVSSMHSHLLTESPVIALAVPPDPDRFEETYAYALRADGVVLCARFEIKMGLLDAGPEGKPKMGWLPWTGEGTVTWITGRTGELILTTKYQVQGDPWSDGFSDGFDGSKTSGISIVEILDNSQFLDMSILVNSPPASLAAPVGYGPLWFIAGQIVQLMDGTRPMSVYQVDSKGNIVPQNLGGEDLASPTLIAGQGWTAVLEPFAPDAPPGQNAGQRMFKRRVSRHACYVSQSTGFMTARLFSGPITPSSPPLGTVMNFKRIPAWNQGDIVTNPPPLREEAYRWRPLGRSFDPRIAIIKDSPGSLIVHEIGMEISV